MSENFKLLEALRFFWIQKRYTICKGLESELYVAKKIIENENKVRRNKFLSLRNKKTRQWRVYTHKECEKKAIDYVERMIKALKERFGL